MPFQKIGESGNGIMLSSPKGSPTRVAKSTLCRRLLTETIPQKDLQYLLAQAFDK